MFVEIAYKDSGVTDSIWINTIQISEVIPWIDLPHYVRMSSGKRYGPLTPESMRRLNAALENETRIEVE